MLARSGALPTRGRFAYEVKWGGFRCVLSTEGVLRIRSRGGWDMTPLLPELASFPVFGTFDGELVAFDDAGAPDFPLICERVLMHRHHVRVAYLIFDVLCLDGVSLMSAPYSERRAQLEALNLNDLYWHAPEAFDDGAALFDAISERELEGIVASG
jgi:bifunctional non-homologous end joining protein LigD